MDTLDCVEPLICIDRSAQPQTIIPGKSHQLQELEREHMRPVRTGYARQKEKEKGRQRDGKKKETISIRVSGVSTMADLVRKV